jgi:DNA topoisomerase I
MPTALVIVESPAKAKTINKYLGQDYQVKSSMGHVRDLPVKASGNSPAKRISTKGLSEEEKSALRKKREHERLIRNLAIDPEHGWKARYEILPGKHKVLKELKILAAKSDIIYLATDLDREGEAIAWHLREAIGGDPERYRRVIFSEITRPAIRAAFEKTTELNIDRVNAQQTRRFLDRVVGFMVSPLLWKKIARGLSAGRVQSVAVRLVVEREREIRAFVPEEYWKLFADLEAASLFRAQVMKYQNKPFKPVSEQEIRAAEDYLKKQTFVVLDRSMKPSKQNPSPPFITTTMQQMASQRLGFSVKKTMLLAQRLYEAGLVTYMRTDSTQISGGAIAQCRNYIESTFGKRYLPSNPRIYASKEGAQEAHEAIRPTDVTKTPEKLATLERDQQRLYDLIWRRFVACQMPAAEFDNTSIDIQAGDYVLRATGRIMRFDGWMRVLPPATKKDDSEGFLPQVTVGQELPLEKLISSQHFTKPPARYTEATLVRELERLGIGRPSTYASIISTIQDRGYVELVRRSFYAQKIGEIVTDRLLENFDDLMDYGFTASMEDDLDRIAQGEAVWREVLDHFYDNFKGHLEQADEKMRPNPPVLTGDIQCPACERPMMIRTARTGVFLSCSGYELPPKERCKETINLVPGSESETLEGEEDKDAKELMAKRRCQVCNTAMESYLVDTETRLHICGNNPDCKGMEIEKGQFRIKGYEGPVIECDKCGADMQLKTGRFGKYFGCTQYPECKNTRKLMRNGQPAPPKADPIPMPELQCSKSDAYFVLRDGASGVFLAAHNFPKSRETRSPRVEDLARHRDELDEKFLYLADAPQSDPDGNPAIIRFKRKEREQVLASEKKGKATKWIAHFENSEWKWTKKSK